MMLRPHTRAIALLTLLLSAACQPPSSGDGGPVPPCAELERSAPAQARSIVFVLSDTLRRDRIGTYGGRARTPVFDAFARSHLRFDAATTQAPWTKPSIATLFTGLLPAQHGVTSHPNLRGAGGKSPMESDTLSGELVTLAELLSAAGYETAAFVSNPWLQKKLGFDQGFDVYDDSFAANDTPGRVVTDAGIEWLRSRTDRAAPFFLYLHYMDAHGPYQRLTRQRLEAHRSEIAADTRPVPGPSRRVIANQARDPAGASWAKQGVAPNVALMELVYDLGVERFDATFGELLERLESLPEAASAALVVASDHGESLHDRGVGSHGNLLFDEEVAIPLVARLPGIEAPGVVSCPIGLVDLLPTLCDYVGASCDANAGFGVSLLEPAASEGRYLVSESVLGRPRNRSIRNERFKLLFEPQGRKGPSGDPAREYALFDLERDPEERVDLLETPDDRAIAIFEELRRALADVPDERVRSATTVPLDEETRRRLEELGYLGD